MQERALASVHTPHHVLAEAVRADISEYPAVFPVRLLTPTAAENDEWTT
jgi:hypothetical protein